jgi:hypothetical protein
MKRLLIVGADGPNALERYYQRAFARQGVEATVFDPEAGLGLLRSGRIINRLSWYAQPIVVASALRAYLARDSNWDAILLFKGLHVPASAIRACRKLTPHASWANLNPDSPFDRGRSTSSAHIRAAITLFDAYFIWSHELVEQLRRAGATRPTYLPFGFDPDSHFPVAALDPALAGMITFVGSYDAQRAAVLESIADQPLLIYGNAWDRLPRHSKLRSKVVSPAIYGAPLRSVVSSSLATINILRPQNRGSHNMRTFEVPAMGGLMLSSRSREQNDFFPEGEACLMYSGPDELRAHVVELSAGRIERHSIMHRARELAQAHAYDARARTILASLALVEV